MRAALLGLVIPGLATALILGSTREARAGAVLGADVDFGIPVGDRPASTPPLRPASGGASGIASASARYSCSPRLAAATPVSCPVRAPEPVGGTPPGSSEARASASATCRSQIYGHGGLWVARAGRARAGGRGRPRPDFQAIALRLRRSHWLQRGHGEQARVLRRGAEVGDSGAPRRARLLSITTLPALFSIGGPIRAGGLNDHLRSAREPPN